MLKVIYFLFVFSIASTRASKMVCYYDSVSHIRKGPAQMTIQDLEPALQFCQYLVYGYADIDPETYQIRPLNKDLDIIKNHYSGITSLKRSHPQLQILLSVGGDREHFNNTEDNPYLSLLESQAHRNMFVNSVVTLLKAYDFDGLDLAWKFPKDYPIVVENKLKKAWKTFKGWFSGQKVVDAKSEEHKTQFTIFVRELKDAFHGDGFGLTLTMLPHVNADLFIDIPNVIPFLDFVNLGSYDFQTPERDPKVADHTAPIYEMFERDPTHNIDYQVQYWLNNSAPSNKINIGIPAYGRSWIMSKKSGLTGFPPIENTDGPGPAGKQVQINGLMSWPEICEKLQRDKEFDGEDAPLRKVGDPRQRYGSYAYRSADEEGLYGLWVGYEEPSTAAIKAGYVFAKGLGGVALYDLSLDDFRGQCAGEKYPILRSIKFKL